MDKLQVIIYFRVLLDKINYLVEYNRI
jgi:hypothetical protein